MATGCKHSTGSLQTRLKRNLTISPLTLCSKPSRPGILVLINDTDWELEGELDYQLQDNDEVVFISTLHGG